jgi:hypothetical protein
VNRRSSTIALEKEIQMFQLSFQSRQAFAVVLAVLIALPQAGLAQAPAKPTAAKPAAEKSVMQEIQLLFVQNSTGMQYDKAKGTLRLKNVAHSTLFFTDRPVRMAGHYHTRDEFLPAWSEGPDSFAKNPPNATLSMLEVGNPDLANAVVTLRNPRMHGNDLVYDVKIVEGKVPQAAGAAVLFIDVLGVWRRHARRWAVVGTTAAVATASAATASAEASAAAAQQAAAAKPPPPATVSVQVTAPPPAPQSASAQKLEQLKALLSEGLITQAQYQKASTQILNEMVK